MNLFSRPALLLIMAGATVRHQHGDRWACEVFAIPHTHTRLSYANSIFHFILRGRLVSVHAHLCTQKQPPRPSINNAMFWQHLCLLKVLWSQLVCSLY